MPTSVALIKYHLSKAGGLEKQTQHVISAFKQAGAQVDLITAESLGLKKKPLSYQNIKLFDRSCTSHLKRHPYPLIFTMDRISSATHIRAGNGCHAAYLNHRKKFESKLKSLTFPHNPLHRTLLHLEKSAFENPRLQKLITNSHMVKKEILSHYNLPESKIVVIHNGVEWHEYENSFSDFQENSRYHFLFIGSGFKRKGLSLLLHALAHLKEKNWKLSIVGSDREMSYYLNLTERLHLTPYVNFYGKRSDTTFFYQKADCLVLPTQYDPFANTTIEALAMGLTVLTSKSNGGHEVLQKETGIIIEELTSQESLITSLQKALSRPKTKKRAQMIRNSVQSYTFENQLANLTKECLNF